MSQLYTMAIREVPPIVTVNPFAALELPAIQPNAIDFFTRDEAEALFDAVEELSGNAARTLVELGMWVGLRPGELYGLHGHRVNWLRGTVEVIDVMTRSGLRQWPKSKKSHRVVPVPGFVMDGMSACMKGRSRGRPGVHRARGRTDERRELSDADLVPGDRQGRGSPAAA